MSYRSLRQLDFQESFSPHHGNLIMTAHPFRRNVVQSDLVRCLLEVDLDPVSIRDAGRLRRQRGLYSRSQNGPKMLTKLLPSADRVQALFFCFALGLV